MSDEGGGNLGIGFAVPINTVRDLLPQLQKGKVIRGRIGVLAASERRRRRTDIEELGLAGNRRRASSATFRPGPARNAGIKLGDVIVEFNGKPVTDNDELVGDGDADRAGHDGAGEGRPRRRRRMTLNVTVDELNLDDEAATSELARREASGLKREQPKETGFGMTIEAITPDIARQLRLPAGRTGVGRQRRRAGVPAVPERPASRRRHRERQRSAGDERRRGQHRARPSRRRPQRPRRRLPRRPGNAGADAQAIRTRARRIRAGSAETSRDSGLPPCRSALDAARARALTAGLGHPARSADAARRQAGGAARRDAR